MLWPLSSVNGYSQIVEARAVEKLRYVVMLPLVQRKSEDELEILENWKTNKTTAQGMATKLALFP